MASDTWILAAIRAGSWLSRLSLVLAIICWAPPIHADQSQSFVWLADTRGDANNDVIDTSVLTPIVNSILALNPAPQVVIFGGDAAYRGGTANLTQFQQVFGNRLTAAGIPWAFAIGNHELYTTGDHAQYLTRQQDFQAMFNSNWPQNGPPGYNNLAFSFQMGNSLFIITDSFHATSNATEPSYGISNTDPQLDWMKGLLQNDTASNIFVFTHVPAFSAITPSPNPDSDMKDAWQTITTAGSATNTDASILFAGHQHLYYRALRDGTYQVLAGTAGAPMGCDIPPCPPYGPLQPGDVRVLSYNWAVVSINGRLVTVTVYDQANSVLDYFQVFDNSGLANSVINNTTPILGPQAAGILASSGNTINNSAPMSNVFTGIDAVSNNTITNSGSITPSSGGNGIYVYDNNTITNTAAGSITGNSTDLWGIRVNTGNNVVNQGMVAVSGTNSIAFLAEGDSNTFTNNGILSASGTGSYAAQFLGKGNTLVNSGIISGNIWFDAGGANAFNNTRYGQFNPGSTVYLGGGSLLTNNGVISPGGLGNVFSPLNGNGPTTVSGNFAQGSTGNYWADLRFLANASSDQADRINVSGTAAVNGLVSLYIDAPGTTKPQSTSLVILNAVGGVTNNGLTLNPWSLNGPALTTAVFTPSLGFDGNNVYLDYAVNFAPFGLTGNQTRVGTAINAIQAAWVPSFQPIAARIFLVPNVAALGQSYDSLSGEGTSAAQQAVFNSRGQFFDVVLSQAALLMDSGPIQYALAAAPIGPPAATAWRVWAGGFGNGGNQDGRASNPGSAKATFTNGGGAVGIDYRVSPNILVGFTAGGADAGFDVPDRYTLGSASGVNLGLYGMAMLGSGIYVQGVLSYGYYKNDVQRDLVGQNIAPTEIARGSFGSNLLGGRFEAGWKSTLGQANLTPFASIQFDVLSQHSYSESSVVNGTSTPGIMGLQYSARSVTSVPLSLGLQVDESFPVGGGKTITPSARISWVHEFASTRSINAAFLAAPDFTFGVRGAAAAENAARVDAGLAVRFSPQFALYGNFVGTFSGAGTAVGGLAGIKYSF